MFIGETILSGSEHPGTPPMVLSSPAGYYIGFKDKDGSPWTRETLYFKTFEEANDWFRMVRT